ncbi:amidase [Aquabacterium sp. OR-4]|uniref:amidase n=1 Tax=Aquabacterium sp. OR-4 TaxID=2978127 RepID=UPI0028C6AC3D|nr:amidase [Aquabacterium sp. OR-4]MDT7839028.1 amidase [Aquabacterium sp. OR-4]
MNASTPSTHPFPPHCLVAALPPGARASAAAASGPAFVVKDTLDVAGQPTRAGSAALADAAPATHHAEVVQRLVDAGWQLLGKTTLHELAFGTTGINHHAGTPLNPAWPERVPGGSSSGSAVAVASGAVALALGTDTGGSVRTPAACCGVFGLKPSFGRVSRAGVMPARSSLDCVGPFAADMATLVAAMQALCPGFGDLPALPADWRIGLVDVAADAAARDAVTTALARAGQPVRPVQLSGFDAAYEAGLKIIQRETWAACQHLWRSGRVGADVALRLERASHTRDDEVAAAEALRRVFSAEVDAALQHCTVLALPTLASPPPRLADAADTLAAVAMTRLVRPFNLTGHPAISLPLNRADGLPVGLQLVGRHGDDETLCAAAQALTERLGLRAVSGATQ